MHPAFKALLVILILAAGACVLWFPRDASRGVTDSYSPEVQKKIPPALPSPSPELGYSQDLASDETWNDGQGDENSHSVVGVPNAKPPGPGDLPDSSEEPPGFEASIPSPTAMASDFPTARTAGGVVREMSIPVPPGAKVPVVFFESAEDLPPQQVKALDRIAQEFEANVSEIPPGMTEEEVWEAARAIADQSYLTLYGYHEFNHYHIQSAKEALREKRKTGERGSP